MVENALTELRFRFVQAMEQHQKQKAAKPESGAPGAEPKEQAGS